MRNISLNVTKRIGFFLAVAFCIVMMSIMVSAQTPVPMASQPGLSYTENFSDIANWTDNFASGTGANRFGSVAVNATGTIPDGVRTTVSTATFQTSGSSGGVQRGSLSGNPAGTIVLLSTGATSNTSACAIDFFLDFTGVNAGTISFDWTRVNNSTGDRGGSLRVYTSTDGSTFTELTSAAVNNIINNGGTASGSITTITLPASFNNSSTARIRFYYFNGTTTGASGSRPKISMDNLTVTATAISNTNFYSKSTGNLNDTATWGTNTEGSGTSPTDFTTSNQVFNIRNNTSPTIGANWTVSGSGSKVVLGDPTVTAINFTVPGNFSFTGTIDIAAASSGSNTLTLQNSTIPTFGTLNAASTVDYNGSGAQTVSAANYGNLTISGTRTSNNVTLANGTIDVTGTFSATATFTIGTYVPGTSTVNFSSASAQTIPAINYNTITNSGNGNRTLASGTISLTGNFTPGTGTYTATGNTVNFNGSGTQTISGTPTFNNVTISNSGSGVTAPSGTMNVAGDFTNNGVFNANSGTVVFNNSGLQTISGSATTTTFSKITLNKGSSTAKVSASINVSMSGGTEAITYTNGTWEQTAGTLTFTSGNQSITTNGGLSLTSSASASFPSSLTGAGGSGGLTGTLSVNTSGTFLLGTGNNRLEVGSGGSVTFTAGTITINGRLTQTSGTTTINGATINIDPQADDALGATSNVFEAAAAASGSMSSGFITIVDPLSATGTGREISLTSGAGTKTFSGGTISLGDGTSSTAGSIDGFEVVTGGIVFNNLIVANQQGGSNRTVNLGNVQGTATASALILNGSLTINSGGTLNANVGTGSNITLKGDWTNSGTFTSGTQTTTFNGTTNQTIGGSSSTTFSTLAISNTGTNGNNTVSLAQNTTVNTALNITQGIFDQGTGASSSNLTTNAVTVSSVATFQNLGTGDLTLSGNVSNSGTINFNANGTPCGDTDDILIRSSINGTQRTWSGNGTFSMTDVNVKDQTTGVGVVILVNSGTDNAGTNGSGWVFVDTCTSGSYIWIGGLNADWQVATNWSPTRTTPNPADVLIFDGNNTPSPIVTDVPTQTIAALRLVNNNVSVKLNASSVSRPQKHTLSGRTCTDLQLTSGTRLTLAGSSALKISVASGSTGVIDGQIIFQDAAHRLLGNAANAITFNSGAIFTTSTGFTGNAFGTGGTNDGFAGSIIFANGSAYFHNAGSSPFGTSGNTVVTFQTGSEADFITATGFDANGRTYANLVIGKADPGGIAVNASDSGTGSFQFDNLTIKSTASASSSLTYTGSGTSTITIQGNITSNGAGNTGTLPDVTLTAGSGGISVNKPGNTVTFSDSSNTRSVNLDGNVTVTSTTTLALNRIVQLGLSNPNSKTVTVNGTLTGGASGYVIGSLLRNLSGGSGSSTFHVGTPNGYSPVTLNITSNPAPTTFKVSADNSYASWVSDQTQAIKRTWTLTSGEADGTLTADVTFQYVPGAPPTGDVSSGITDTNALVAYRHNADNSINQMASTASGNTVTVSGIAQFSDWTLANPNSLAPTLVRLTGFGAVTDGSTVQISWQSGYEAHNLGYHVYREVNGQRTRITPSIVAGSALLAGRRTVLTAGQTYTWYDRLPNGVNSALVTYWLEDIDTNGARTLNGPITPLIGTVTRNLSEQARAELLSEMNSVEASNDDSTQPSWPTVWPIKVSPISGQINELRVAGAGTTLTPLERQQQIAGMQAVKLAVNRTGWQRVNQSDLIAAGLKANADQRMLQLYSNGVEVPISDNAAGIEFYGVAQDTATSDAQTYYLIVGTAAGKRIPVKKGGGGVVKSDQTQGSFNYTIERRDRTTYFAGLNNGDADSFFGAIITSDEAVSESLQVMHLDTTRTGQTTLDVSLQGVTDGAHHVSVQFNGIAVGTVNFSGVDQLTKKFSINTSQLREGAKTLQFVATGGEGGISLVDSVRLNYGHTYAADNNRLSFVVTNTQPVQVDGFNSSSVRVIDITNPSAVEEVSPTIQKQANGSYSVTVNVAGASRTNAHTLLMVNDSQAEQPASVTRNKPSSLAHSTGADFLIITHNDFLGSVQPLAQLRRSQGMTVNVVDVEEVYDEFSFCAHSPPATRDILSTAVSGWTVKPRYALMAGDATYDPRDYLGFGRNDMVPTKLLYAGTMKTASDDWFVDFNSDDVPDIAMGRLPVRAASEATLMVSKIVSYVPQTGQGALLIADRNDNDNNFEGASQALMHLLPSGMQVQVINRGSTDVSTVHSQIDNGLEQGPLVANYYGHGSGGLWTGSGLLGTDDAATLTNGNRLPLLTAMTCLNGFFHDVSGNSMAEAFLKSQQGGAVAVWASSGLTNAPPQAEINQRFYQILFGSTSVTVGDAIRGAKTATQDQAVRRTWIFFGDPTMKLR